MTISSQRGNATVISIVVVLLLIIGAVIITRTPAEAPEVVTTPEAAMEQPMDSGTMLKDDAMKDGDSMMHNDTPMDGSNELMTDDDGTAMMKDDAEAMMKDDSATMEQPTSRPGTFEDYSAEKLALAEDGDAVIYFSAAWCPTCRSLNKDIENNLGNIPDNTHILKANYDTERDLKKKYEVTYQHTFVQVDEQGNLIKKWGGSPTLAAVLKEIQ